MITCIYKPNIKCTGIIFKHILMYVRIYMYMLISYSDNDLLLLYSLIEPVVEVIGQGK